MATQLDALAATLAREGSENGGTTRTRFVALATIVEDLADRVR